MSGKLQDAIDRVDLAIARAQRGRTKLAVDAREDHVPRRDIGVVPEREGRADGAIGIGALDIRQQLQRQRLLVADRIVFGFLEHHLEGGRAYRLLALGSHGSRHCQRWRQEAPRQHRDNCRIPQGKSHICRVIIPGGATFGLLPGFTPIAATPTGNAAPLTNHLEPRCRRPE